MTKRDYTRVLLVIILVLGTIYLVNNDTLTTQNSNLKNELAEERKLFKEVLSKKDNEIEQLTKKISVMEKDIALQETSK